MGSKETKDRTVKGLIWRSTCTGVTMMPLSLPHPRWWKGRRTLENFHFFSARIISPQKGGVMRETRVQSHTLGLGGEGRRTDRGISSRRGSCLVQSMGVPPRDRGGVPLGISEPQTSMRLHGLRVEEYETVG